MLTADKRQGVFKQTLRGVRPPRINSAHGQGLAHDAASTRRLLRKIEAQFGVPGAIAIVLWGLETDFGTNTGKHEVLRATATLGFDCRRTECSRTN